MKSPLVTIIITCYNYANYVGEAIESVISQTYRNIDLLVINDGSTDGSHQMIESLKRQYKFRYINKENEGIIATRNLGIDLATGDYQLQLDADDTIPKNYVEALVKCAEKESADIVYADYVMFGNRSEKSKFPEYSLEELKNHNFINTSALVRIGAIGKSRFDSRLSNMTHEDWDFFLGLCLDGAKGVKCDTTHLNYRMHGKGRNNTLTAEEDKLRYAQMFMYITGKHSASNPDQFEYLSGRIFAPWFIDAHISSEAHRQTIADLSDRVDSLVAERQELKNQLGRLPARRARRFIVGAFGWARRCLSRKQKNRRA